MEEKESAAGEEDWTPPDSPAKIPVTPRKEKTSPLVSPGDGLRLAPNAKEPIWDRRNRIRPSAPKVPFQQPLRDFDPAKEVPPVAYRKSGSTSNQGLLSYFRHRRKGRSRVVNVILLPLAVLLTLLTMHFLLKLF